MRTPAVLGASLLLLASLAAAGPAVATEETWDGDVSGLKILEGDFGVAGTVYEWDGKGCPAMGPDEAQAKVEVGEGTTTVSRTAPEGQVIWAYCVKSGSENNGFGPRIVVLDDPKPTVTVTYAMPGDPKDISHYAVAFTTESTPLEPKPSTSPSPSPSASPTPTKTTTPPTPAETTTPPTPTKTTTPPTDEETPSETPLPTAPTDGSTPGLGGADYVDDESDVVEASSPALGGASGRVSADVEAAAAPESLPVTGAQVLGIVMAAVALVGAGVGALIWTRQRRTS